jgi:predicted nucleic acid-binding protein
LIVVPPGDERAVASLRQTGLAAGESEAIVLAERRDARLILDERRARRVARTRGIAPISTVTVVVAASELRLIGVDDVEPLLRRMQAAGFYLAEQIIQDAVAEARRSP